MVQILPRVPSFGERLAEGLGSGLGEGFQRAMQSLADQYQQKQTGKYFSELAGKHPEDPKYQMLAEIYSSPMAGEHKSALVKAMIAGQDPYRAIQQERLTKDSLSSQYNRAIGEIDSAIKNGVYGMRGPQFDQAKERRELLVNERDRLLGILKQQEKEASDFDEEEEGFVEEYRPRPKFDSTNVKHRAVRDKLIKQLGGDTPANRQKAGKILSKAFKL